MKIGIEGQRLFRKKKHGMDIVALELIKNLQKIDTKNEYVVFVKPDEDSTCLHETDNIKIVEVEASSYPVWEQIALPKAVMKEKCDILHCTSNTAPLNINIPIIITLHDIIYLEGIKLGKNGGTWYQKLGNIYRRWNVPRVVKKADAIITVSNFEKNQIDKYFRFEESKVNVVYNGFSTHFHKITDENELEQIREKYDLPKKFLFFLGNTDPKKNTKNVLKGYAHFIKHHEAIPLLMPDFGENNLIKLLKEIDAIHIRKHIQLTGYIVNSDLPYIYNLCEVFLYPSLRESFGIPLLEAMACGTPVISSDTSSLPEISDGAAHIVNPFDFKDIGNAIYTVLQNDFLRDYYVAKGYERVTNFSWGKTAAQMMKIYSTFDSRTEKHNNTQKKHAEVNMKYSY